MVLAQLRDLLPQPGEHTDRILQVTQIRAHHGSIFLHAFQYRYCLVLLPGEELITLLDRVDNPLIALLDRSDDLLIALLDRADDLLVAVPDYAGQLLEEGGGVIEPLSDLIDRACNDLREAVELAGGRIERNGKILESIR